MRPLLAAGGGARDGWAPIVGGGAAVAAPRGVSLGATRGGASRRQQGARQHAAAVVAALSLRPVQRELRGRGRWAAWAVGPAHQRTKIFFIFLI